MSYVFSAHPTFNSFDISNDITKQLADIWHDRQQCGGPLFGRSLDCDHQKGIKVPSVSQLLSDNNLERVGFYQVDKIRKNELTFDYFNIDFLLAVPVSWPQFRKNYAKQLLEDWQSSPGTAKCCFERGTGNSAKNVKYLQDYLYGVGRIVLYKGNEAGEPNSHLQFIYEGQYQGSFKGFGRYVFYYYQRLAVGWWQGYPQLNGKGIFYENGELRMQGIYSYQEYW